MEKEMTVQDLIDRLSVIPDKNIPVTITIGSNRTPIAEGDVFDINNISITVDKTEDGKSTISSISLVTKSDIKNELAQLLVSLSPSVVFGRIITACNRFSASDEFNRFKLSCSAIAQSMSKNIKSKLSKENLDDLKTIEDALKRMASR